MRIRIFHAFASNNSGSYTIVGTFESAEVASDVARLLRQVCDEHSSWFAQHAYDDDGESPLDAFARAHGLTEEKPGRSDDWPEDGAPRVLGVAHQVLVHVPMTIAMPRLFGEFFYKRGGRVEIELDHVHDRLAVELSFHAPGLRSVDPEKLRREQLVVTELQELLPDLVHRFGDGAALPIQAVFHPGFFGSTYLTAVFDDLLTGIEAVRAVAAQHGLEILVRVRECPDGLEDPLAHLRGATRPWGRSRVILWAIGSDRIAALKAVREVLGAEVEVGKAAIEGLPKEILVEVDASYAERAVQRLREVGCDAEAVVPARSPTRD